MTLRRESGSRCGALARCSRVAAVALWVAASATGCASRSLMQPATTLAPGESRLGAVIVGTLAHDHSNTIPSGTVEVAYRVGLADGADVGLRAFPVGARLDAKVRLYGDRRVSLAADLGAVASGLSYEGGEGDLRSSLAYYVGGSASLLAGFRVDGSEIVVAAHFAPGYGSTYTEVPAGSPGDLQPVSFEGYLIESGLLIGADILLGDIFHLMPEVGVLYRFGEQRDAISMLNRDPIVLHVGIGGYFHWTL